MPLDGSARTVLNGALRSRFQVLISKTVAAPEPDSLVMADFGSSGSGDGSNSNGGTGWDGTDAESDRDDSGRSTFTDVDVDGSGSGDGRPPKTDFDNNKKKTGKHFGALIDSRAQKPIRQPIQVEAAVIFNRPLEMVRTRPALPTEFHDPLPMQPSVIQRLTCPLSFVQFPTTLNWSLEWTVPLRVLQSPIRADPAESCPASWSRCCCLRSRCGVPDFGVD